MEWSAVGDSAPRNEARPRSRRARRLAPAAWRSAGATAAAQVTASPPYPSPCGRRGSFPSRFGVPGPPDAGGDAQAEQVGQHRRGQIAGQADQGGVPRRSRPRVRTPDRGPAYRRRRRVALLASGGLAHGLVDNLDLDQVVGKASLSWNAFTLGYVAAKWPCVLPNHRRGIAEALTDVAEVMLASNDVPRTLDEIRGGRQAIGPIRCGRRSSLHVGQDKRCTGRRLAHNVRLAGQTS